MCVSSQISHVNAIQLQRILSIVKQNHILNMFNEFEMFFYSKREHKDTNVHTIGFSIQMSLCPDLEKRNKISIVLETSKSKHWRQKACDCMKRRHDCLRDVYARVCVTTCFSVCELVTIRTWRTITIGHNNDNRIANRLTYIYETRNIIVSLSVKMQWFKTRLFPHIVRSIHAFTA